MRERASMCAKGLVGVNSIVYKWMNECIFCFVVCTNSLVSNARICDCVPLVAIKFDFTHDNYIWTLRQTYNSSHLWEPLRDAVLSVLLFVNCHFASFSRLIAACFHFLLLKCLSWKVIILLQFILPHELWQNPTLTHTHTHTNKLILLA